MKDNMYTRNDDGNIPQENSYTPYISQNVWCSLKPNKLTTQLIDWVKSRN